MRQSGAALPAGGQCVSQSLLYLQVASASVRACSTCRWPVRQSKPALPAGGQCVSQSLLYLQVPSASVRVCSTCRGQCVSQGLLYLQRPVRQSGPALPAVVSASIRACSTCRRPVRQVQSGPALPAEVSASVKDCSTCRGSVSSGSRVMAVLTSLLRGRNLFLGLAAVRWYLATCWEGGGLYLSVTSAFLNNCYQNIC